MKELGWPVIAVLKQERCEVYQETLALTRGQKPAQQVERDGREVEIWHLDSLRFSDTYPDLSPHERRPGTLQAELLPGQKLELCLHDKSTRPCETDESLKPGLTLIGPIHTLAR